MPTPAPLTTPQARALTAAALLTRAGVPSFSRADLSRVALGRHATAAQRSAFAHTVRALMRTGRLAAHVDADTLRDLAQEPGTIPESRWTRLRSGDARLLANEGHLVTLSLPATAPNARVAA